MSTTSLSNGTAGIPINCTESNNHTADITINCTDFDDHTTDNTINCTDSDDRTDQLLGDAENGEDRTVTIIPLVPLRPPGAHGNGNIPPKRKFSKAIGMDDDDDDDDIFTRRGVMNHCQPRDPRETFFSILLQVFIPFFVAGWGMVGAGLVLDTVQNWKAFEEMPMVFILVPALLGLKGNLEMTLASRLSTQANLGNMDTMKSQWSMAVGNLSLIQCQAIIVGFLASVAAAILNCFGNGDFDRETYFIVCAASIITASVASFILGMVMLVVVSLARRCNINPDNVATPIAASLGDVTTLSLLAWVLSRLYAVHDRFGWLPPVIIAGFFIVSPFWAFLAKRNKYTTQVLYTGWIPVLSAMIISSLGGMILHSVVDKFRSLAIFQPVINGVGGNLVAVQASRISTALHRDCEPGELPDDTPKGIPTPYTVFFMKGGHARTARILMLVVIPGHLIFSYAIRHIRNGHVSITPVFLTAYLIAAVFQVAILLYVCQIIVQWMWKQKIDPDNSAIPYLTALGDLLGTAMLAFAFYFLYLVGDVEMEE